MGSTLAKTKVREDTTSRGEDPMWWHVITSVIMIHFFSYAIRQPINFIAASDQEVDLFLRGLHISTDGSLLIEKAFSINHKKIVICFKKGEILGFFLMEELVTIC